MNRIEEAIHFATKAHHGQMRKMENVSMLFHPLTVGIMLMKEGCDDDVVIAGILHDVIEDTEYTKGDIEEKFGERVAELVDGVSESDKSLAWEERKKETIEYTRNAPIEIKMIECADKISNLESLLMHLNEKGEEVWDSFKRGRDKQKWYHTSMYESICANTQGKNELFERYGGLVKKVFG